jgi:hypothetical protein
MKAIVMRQTKTLPLITLMKRIDQRAAGSKQENVPESVCDGTKTSVIGARQDSEEMSGGND